MKVAITGASGLVGTAVTRALEARGDEVYALKRNKDWHVDLQAAADSDWVREESLQGCDALIHLAGDPIAKGRWSPQKKKAIVDSRVRGTRLLAQTLANMAPDKRPGVMLCASAVGYYGSSPDQTFTETSEQGQGFLADTCAQWEHAASDAKEAGVRVLHARLGMVLAREGGALKEMLLPFKLGAGGVLGDGKHYWSWITLTDTIAAMLFLLDQPTLSGPVNLVSPTPVTNRQFTQAMGRALHRPVFMKVPVFALRLLMGGMVDEVLLSSTRVSPAVLQAAGFRFQNPELDQSLKQLLK